MCVCVCVCVYKIIIPLQYLTEEFTINEVQVVRISKMPLWASSNYTSANCTVLSIVIRRTVRLLFIRQVFSIFLSKEYKAHAWKKLLLILPS